MFKYVFKNYQNKEKKKLELKNIVKHNNRMLRLEK